MANIQISEELYILLYKYFIYDQNDLISHRKIQRLINEKMNKLMARTYYTDYLNAQTDEKRQEAIDNYLNAKQTP